MEKVGRLDWIARAGFVARGLLYVLFGIIALTFRSKADEGQSAVFAMLGKAPLGSALLILLASGLAAYGLFRLTCAWLDIEGKGRTLKGLAGRAAQAGSGLLHLGLAWSAIQFLIGLKRSYDHAGDQNSRAAVKTIFDLQLGDTALYAIALGFVFAAGLQLRKAWKEGHMKQCRADTPDVASVIGRVGLASRGAVFAVIAWSFYRTAQTHDAEQAHAVGGAIASLQSHDWLYLAVCIGVILFGVFSLMLARYRIVPKIDVTDAARHAPG